ncbi:CDK-activating kinase assembly factor MAT1 [Sphaerodactylus townsendi]|uniref:CDK-activating kinase assembly factor MAT1 n=1 Tax=Sphaerodactylus townsendi TaxID=933632 RepID=UPI0020274240|nr:CDK-activating kinase assembly factor MAT1 [Sphaerodactylus townsendi]
MDDQGCPRCKTTKYRNPSLKLMVNVCGHTLCESCVELLFVRGAGNCQECGTPLRKSNFRVQLFEDPAVDKEVEIRKKVLKIKAVLVVSSASRDFSHWAPLSPMGSAAAPPQHLLSATEPSSATYSTNLFASALRLPPCSGIKEGYERQVQHHVSLPPPPSPFVLSFKHRLQESSHLPASLLLAQHKDRSTQLDMQLEIPKLVKPVAFSTGIKMGQQIVLAPAPKIKEALYEYQPLHVETYGPPVPEVELLGKLGYLNHVRAASRQDLAGGYVSSLACHRALQDAFSGLFWHPS